MHELAIVIVSYNQQAYLMACLESLEREITREGVDARIVVVDNASHDGSVEAVRQAFPTVTLIENQANRGFAAACNQGGAACESRYVLLVNNDLSLLPGSLGTLLSFARAQAGLGGVSARLIRPDGTEQLPALGWKRLLGARPLRLNWLPCACLLLSREALDQVGWLDDAFFFYNEDIDLGMRLRKAGRPLWYLPAATVIHHEGKSTDAVRPMTVVEGYRGGLYLTHKHYGSVAHAVAKCAVALEVTLRNRYHRLKLALGLPLSHHQQAHLKAYPDLRALLSQKRSIV